MGYFNVLWLHHFITSVNWRTRYLDILGFIEKNNDENKITDEQLQTLIKAEEIKSPIFYGNEENQ
jgi:hypothetical protein